MGRLFPRSTGPSDARSQEDEQRRAEELYAFAAVLARAGLPIACGKIMRRVLKAITLDKDPGDISTIEDAGSVQDAREAWEAMRKQISVH